MATKEDLHYRLKGYQAPQVSPPETAMSWAERHSAKNKAAMAALEPYRKENEERKQVLKAVLDREFWAQDVSRNTGITSKNLVSQIAGFPSDIVGLMAMIYASDPIRDQLLKSKLGVDSVLDVPSKIPGNSEQIAELLGGDPEHPSWLPTGLVAPGPGEIVSGSKAIFGGAFGARNLGIKTLKEFQERGAGMFDVDAWKETGWFNWFDGQPRFHISDADSYIKAKNLSLPDLKPGEGHKLSLTMGEVMDHPELYNAYPMLKEVPIHLHFYHDGDMVRILDPKAKAQGISGRVRANEISVFDAKSDEDLRSVLLHEAQHMVQKIEGFNTGSNSQKFTDTIRQAKQVMAERAVADDILNGIVDPRDPDQAYQYAADIAQEFGLSEDKAGSIVFTYLNADNLDQEVQLLGALENRGLGEVALFLETMGGRGDIENFLKEIPDDVAQKLAHSRYLREGGEVEARLTEYLRNSTTERIQALGKTPAGMVDEIGVKPEQIVVGE